MASKKLPDHVINYQGVRAPLELNTQFKKATEEEKDCANADK
jgi:hypothetical protein